MSIASQARAVAWPALAKLYRRDPISAKRLMLFTLGIADTSYRRDFYTLARIVDQMPSFEGSIIECGVYRGSTLLGMAHRLFRRGIRGVQLIGCDSFEGLPAPSPEDRLGDGTFHSTAQQSFFSDTSCDALASRIGALGYSEDIRLAKGFFNDTLPSFSDLRFSIAHLDCDLYQSYAACLKFLYPRMVRGGHMVFDEYDYSRGVYPGAQRAIDEFFAGKPEKPQRFREAECPRYFIVKE